MRVGVENFQPQIEISEHQMSLQITKEKTRIELYIKTSHACQIYFYPIVT